MNIIRIRVRTISGVRIYSDIRSVNMWHPNIFGYSFGKYVASEYIQIFVWYIMWHPNIFGDSFVPILLYSLINGPQEAVSGRQEKLMVKRNISLLKILQGLV